MNKIKANKILILLISLSLLLIFTLMGCSNDAKQVSEKKSSAPRTNYTANEVLQAFKKANLPIEKIEEYTAETDPNKLLGRPNQYVGKINFNDLRIEDESIMDSGTIEVFDSQEDLMSRKTYVESISKSSSIFAQYIYSRKNILLRLDHQLTPSQATEYENILNKL